MAFNKNFEKFVSVDNKKSFFLFAGAGTGKTYTLVELLKVIKRNYEHEFLLTDRYCAVITYTNAATDEIKRRIDYSPIFHVSTIHSFLWTIIKPFQKDIKETFISFKKNELQGLVENCESAKNKKTKTFQKNQDKIEDIQSEIKFAQSVDEYTYNPNGENLDKNSLNHSDVIKIGSYLISNKPLLQAILISSYPILLIDEGQDTNKNVIEAFLSVQKCHPNDFKLGILGDTKQQIYFDGEPHIENKLNNQWERSYLTVNWRSDKRIVELANKIGMRLDPNAAVEPYKEAQQGSVYLFIKGYSENLNQIATEQFVREQMMGITGDNDWVNGKVQTLLLEHRMAAVRLGFVNLYDCLKKVKKYDQEIKDGSIPELFIFKNVLLPLETDIQKGDNSSLYQIVKDNSSLLNEKFLSQDKEPFTSLHQINDYIKTLGEFLSDGTTTIGKVVKFINDNKLFNISPVLSKAIATSDQVQDGKEEITAWRECFKLPYNEVRQYMKYVSGQSGFGTHQGVKGLEYDRVMVIIDDMESKGFMFSYDKLFGVKPLTETDRKNIDFGQDSSLERTMRLFYVVCTRAKHSLAIVAYTSSPKVVKDTCLKNRWFQDKEITIL
jgi:DNA helicase-2/ATP-dependent DNA helicase PcrA